VLDGGTSSSKSVLAELRKPEVRAALTRLALWNTRSAVDAEDLVESALLRTLDPEDNPWAPEERTFLTHMTHVMRQVWWLERRERKRMIPGDPAAVGKGLASPDPPLEEQLERQRSLAVYRQLAERLTAELASTDPIAAGVYDLYARGIDDAATVAAEVPCKVDEVYPAVRRIRYRARELLAEWETNETERMKQLRKPVKVTKGSVTP
jgi:DNA-directed RNA polymerase specialized sigma24 family protein